MLFFFIGNGFTESKIGKEEKSLHSFFFSLYFYILTSYDFFHLFAEVLLTCTCLLIEQDHTMSVLACKKQKAQKQL